MGLFNTFRNWEHKYALTFMGVILAFLFGGFSVYVYLQKTAPNLRVEEISNANVIDVREDVGKLDILFNGANLRDKHQTLALVTLRVMNDGAAPISKGAYDDVDPIGLEVNGGDITKAELFNASSTNIAKSMKVFVLTNSMVTFAPVILEAGDFFWIKLLILHSEKGN